VLVRDRMTANPITVRPGSDPLAGVALCKSGGFCRLPVVDGDGRLVGIVTENDLHRFLSIAPSPGVMQRQHRVEQLMNSPVVTVPPDYPLEEAARLMIRHDVGGLPVVDEEGRVIGMITRSDIFAHFVEALGAGTPALRITVEVADRPGELAELARRIAGVEGNISSVISHPAREPGWMILTLRVEGVERQRLLSTIRAGDVAKVLQVWERESGERAE